MDKYYQKAEDLSQKALNHIKKYKIHSKNNETLSYPYSLINSNNYLKMLSCYFGAVTQLKKSNITHTKDKADITYKIIPELKKQINHLKKFKNQNNARLYLNQINNPMPITGNDFTYLIQNMLYIKKIE
jgi:hypothetical protein